MKDRGRRDYTFNSTTRGLPDVYDKEPLPQSHPLRASGNTVLTPHLGYAVEETWRDFYPRSIENALAFLDGAPIRVLNAS